MPIILPPHVGWRAYRVPTSPTISVYHRLSDLTGTPVSVPDLTQTLGKLKKSEVIRLLIWLFKSVNSEGGMRPENSSP